MAINPEEVKRQLDALEGELKELEDSEAYRSTDSAERVPLSEVREAVNKAFATVRDLLKEGTPGTNEVLKRAEHIFCRFIVIWGWDIVLHQAAGRRFRCNPSRFSDSRFGRPPLREPGLLWECLYEAGMRMLTSLRNNLNWAPQGLNSASFLVPKLTDVLRSKGLESRRPPHDLARLNERIRELSEEFLDNENKLDDAIERGDREAAERCRERRDQLEEKRREVVRQIINAEEAARRNRPPASLDQPAVGEDEDATPLWATNADEPHVSPFCYATSRNGGESGPTQAELLEKLCEVLRPEPDGEILIAVTKGLKRTRRRVTKKLLQELQEQFPKFQWDESLVNHYSKEAYRVILSFWDESL